MNDEEMKKNIIQGIAKQTGLSLMVVRGYDDTVKIRLQDEMHGYWQYSKPIPKDCNIPYFLKQIADLLQDYLFVMKLKEDGN